MYVIVVYDVYADRTHIPRKFLRKYLNHVQNSVFEGHVTESNLSEIKEFIKENIKDEESVFIYELWGEQYVERTIIGDDPMEEDRLI